MYIIKIFRVGFINLVSKICFTICDLLTFKVRDFVVGFDNVFKISQIYY